MIGEEAKDVAKHDLGEMTNTPPMAIADYLMDCFNAFTLATIYQEEKTSV